MTISSTWKQAVCAAGVLVGMCGSAFAADPVVSITASGPAVLGSPLLLDVQVTNALDLYAFQFSLSFDPTLMQATGVTEGGFLSAAGGTSFGVGSVNNTTGVVAFVFNSLLGATPGVDGAGVLASLSFNLTQVGTSGLTFSNGLFLDSNLDTLTVQLQNSSIQVVPEPSSWALFALGIAGLAGLRHRRA